MGFFMFHSPESGMGAMGATAVRISPTQLGNEHQTDKQTDERTDGHTYITIITLHLYLNLITLHYYYIYIIN